MKFSKLLCLVSFAAMLFPLSIHAQLLSGYGAKVGANLSKTSISYTQSVFRYETKNREGLNAAFFLEWGKSSVFSLITQVEYAQRGFKEEQIATDEYGQPIQVVQASTRLDYISLPVMMKLQYPGLLAGPYIAFGPRVDFLVNRVAGKFKFPQGPFESSLHKVFDDRALGGTIGLGFAFDKILHLPLLIEAGYKFDFTENDDSNVLHVKNKSVDFWLGIKF